jgi:hypothetical protein
VRLASIHIYPMKAARAVDLDEACVEPWGLAGDRRWLLVDGNGRFISQREEPSLARVVVQPGAGSISVSADGDPGPAIAPPPADAPLLKVTVWSSTLLAAEAGPAADAWFSAYLGGRYGWSTWTTRPGGRSTRSTGGTGTSSASPTATRCCSPARARSGSSTTGWPPTARPRCR